MSVGHLSQPALANSQTTANDNSAQSDEGQLDPNLEQNARQMFQRVKSENEEFAPDAYFKLIAQHQSPEARQVIAKVYQEVFGQAPPQQAPDKDEENENENEENDEDEQNEETDENAEGGGDGGGENNQGANPNANQNAGGGGGGDGPPTGGGAAGGAGDSLSDFATLSQGELAQYVEEKAFHQQWAQQSAAGGGGGGGNVGLGDRAAIAAQALGTGLAGGFLDGASQILIDTALNKATARIPYAAGFIAMGQIAMDPAGWATGQWDATFGTAKAGWEKLTGEGDWVTRFEGLVGLIEAVNNTIALLSTICMIVAAASFILGLFFPALLPFAALAAQWGLFLGEISTLVGIVILALKFMLMIAQTVKLLTMEGDPEEVAAAATSLQDTSSQWASGYTAQQGNRLRTRIQNGGSNSSGGSGGGSNSSGGGRSSGWRRAGGIAANVVTGGQANNARNQVGGIRDQFNSARGATSGFNANRPGNPLRRSGNEGQLLRTRLGMEERSGNTLFGATSRGGGGGWRNNLDGGSPLAAGYGHQGTGGVTGAGTGIVFDAATGGNGVLGAMGVDTSISAQDVGGGGAPQVDLPPPPMEAEGQLDQSAELYEKIMAEIAMLEEQGPTIQWASEEAQREGDGFADLEKQMEANEKERARLDESLSKKQQKQQELREAHNQKVQKGDEMNGEASGQMGPIMGFVQKFVEMCGMMPSRILGSQGGGGTSGAQKMGQGFQQVGQEGAQNQADAEAGEMIIGGFEEQTSGAQDQSSTAGQTIAQLLQSFAEERTSATEGHQELQATEQLRQQRIQELEAKKAEERAKHQQALQRLMSWTSQHRAMRQEAS